METTIKKNVPLGIALKFDQRNYGKLTAEKWQYIQLTRIYNKKCTISIKLPED